MARRWLLKWLKPSISVFIIDSSIDPSAEFDTIQSDNLANGQLAGEWVAKKFGSKKMKIALLRGECRKLLD
jgi:ribose transport system substrate-binding protein